MSRLDIALFRSALIVVWVGITYLATMPLAALPVPDINDKVGHVLAFFVLSFLVDRSFPRERNAARKAAVLLVYGMLLEIVQYHLPYRSFSLLDWLADGGGVLLYLAVLPLVELATWLRGRRNPVT